MLETATLDVTMPRARILNEAVALWKDCNEGKPVRTEETLPLNEIVARPDLFQVRGSTDAKHVADLAEIIRGTEGDLEPLLLIELGEEAVIINGHHREAAYRAVYGETDPAHPVPVRWFSGDPIQALTRATGENSKTCLVMTREQRKDAATRLAGMVGTNLSKAELAKATGLSTSTIAEIRAGLKKVQELATGDGPLRQEAGEALASLRWSDIQACVELSKGAVEGPSESEATGVQFCIDESTDTEESSPKASASSQPEAVSECDSAPAVVGSSEPPASEQEVVEKFASLLTADPTETVRMLFACLHGDAGPLARGVFDQTQPVAFLRAGGYVVKPQTADFIGRMHRFGSNYSEEADF